MKINKKFLTLLGLCATAENTDFFKQVQYLATNLSIVIVFFFNSVISTATFILENKGNFSEVTWALFQFIGSVTVAISSISVSVQRKRVRKILNDLQTTVKKCKYFFNENPVSFSISFSSNLQAKNHRQCRSLQSLSRRRE